MKKLISSLVLAAGVALSFTACDDQMEVTDYTTANTGNFPAANSDVDKLLAGAYSALNKMCNDPLQHPYLVYDIMSDEQNGGGGTGDVEAHAIAHLMTNKDALYDNAFETIYQGIARTNSIIFSIDNSDWTGNESDRNQLLGEAYFLRGFYTLWATQFWGDVPAYWEASRPTPCPQQDAETVIYPHILADFVSGASLMNQKTQGDGHATKYTAESYLARAYMFYQGFYKKAGELATASLEAVELPEQEGVTSTSLSKSDVVSALEDVINNGGYELVGDFRNLWQYTNELTVDDYDYTKDVTGVDGQKLLWAGNGNSEEIFQIQFGNIASWNGTVGMGYTNMSSLYMALRCDADADGKENGGQETFPFGYGWGQGTVTQQTWDNWPDTDLRKRASILNCDEEIPDGFAYTTSCTEETGKYDKKNMPITCLKGYDGTASTGTDWDDYTNRYTWWACIQADYVCSNGNSFQGSHYGDMILMRLADVYLMHSELTGDATYMNKVRARAGLSAVSYSWTNIQNERQWELAFEGLRFNDLRRWSGKNGGSSCLAATKIQGAKEGQSVNYTGTWATMHHASSSWSERYAATDGFLPIPPSEIEKVNDESLLKQNAGWGSSVSGANMSGTPVYN